MGGKIDKRPCTGSDGTARRRFPGHGVSYALVHELPEWQTVAVEDLTGLVDVIRENESTHGIHRDFRVELVDPCLWRHGRVSTERIRRIDEPEQPTAAVKETRSESDLCGGVGCEGECRCEPVERHFAYSTERVDDTKRADCCGSPEERMHGAVGERVPRGRVSHEYALIGHPQELFAKPIE